MSRKLVFTFFIVILLIASTPFILYYYKLGSPELSTDHEEWGQFGDFIGGTLNPFLSLVSIFVLAYITYEVSQIETHIQQRSLDTQRVLVLTQLRQAVLEEYARLIDIVLSSYDQTSRAIGDKAGETHQRLQVLHENHQHVFPIFTSDTVFNEVLVTLEAITSSNSMLNGTGGSDGANTHALTLAQNIYRLEDLKKEAKSRLQSFMLESLSG
ncbi:hypothetical protein [Pontibacter chinhatensis]|uniref:Uncharacterized protein n=1 Tax=Pontibacter chinhatensis TaxID=1436961 RepID=A0A1I2ZM27_9BACT|nr:hypothetical protein [Pontibacter chinhatensis]SFH38912.1 hypothetical protein SAMN05421739_1165 [Pontibacter chinhatensis]